MLSNEQVGGGTEKLADLNNMAPITEPGGMKKELELLDFCLPNQITQMTYCTASTPDNAVDTQEPAAITSLIRTLLNIFCGEGNKYK